jgi:hypothetical protein
VADQTVWRRLTQDLLAWGLRLRHLHVAGGLFSRLATKVEERDRQGATRTEHLQGSEFADSEL